MPTIRQKFLVEYNALRNAIDRCTRTTHSQYADYGGRGITVDPEFLCPVTGFVTFLADVGAKPHRSLSLERISNDKGYVKGNLKWTDRASQQANRRKPVAKVKDLGWGMGSYKIMRKDGRPCTKASPLVPFGDRIQTIKAWCDELGIDGHTLRQRFYRGWTPEQALTSKLYNPMTPPKKN